jgi:3-oxoacyl-[acyl-carrier protein] reductase
MKLKDQVALVTGGSRGIGRAIVREFVAEGAKVAFVYRGDQAAAESLLRECAAAGRCVLALQGDVADAEAAVRCVERVTEEWGRLDVLVNNAGVIRDDLFVRLEPEAWDAVLRTNLGGTYHFCRAAAFGMMRQRRGRIINVSSVAADHPKPGQANYAASKGAINSLTRALAAELACRNVTVNAIAPGFIETDMSAAVLQQAGEQLRKAIPLRRAGRAEEVARVAVFLAGPDSSYMTGQVLPVDGGLGLGAAAG